MIPKNFENFELRLKTLREEQRESYELAENTFEERYTAKLEEIFPRDVLGAKKLIKGSFIIAYVDNLESETSGGKGVEKIFQNSVNKVVSTLPLSGEKKESLGKHILRLSGKSEALEQYFQRVDDLSRDPFFALVEDFSMDGEISREEFLLLSESYGKTGNFMGAIEGLPENLRKMFEGHIYNIFGKNLSERVEEFEGEYSPELQKLQHKGFNIGPVVRFISRSYYKTPGKLRKHEDPRRRLRRTMKMSLLRLLRIKLGNIDAEKMLQKFESGESFEDFFIMLYKLMEIVGENPEGKEVFSLLDDTEETQEEVISAEETKKKILEGEELTANISSLLGETDGKLEGELFEKILEDDTHFHGDEIHFNHEEDKMAGIYAENSSEQEDEDEDDDLLDSGDTLEGNYERLKNAFHEVDEKKRQAFGQGNYDLIDEYNEELMRIESKIIKLSKLLGEE